MLCEFTYAKSVNTNFECTGGRLLLELNRVLRPGGYFVWSATPVYQKLKEDVEIWKGKSPKPNSTKIAPVELIAYKLLFICLATLNIACITSDIDCVHAA